MTERADTDYLQALARILDQAIGETADAREAAARLIADAFAQGGLLYAFGTGHSHLLALDLFYRAGGFAAVNPVLVESLMLHESASRSSQIERTEESLESVLEQAAFQSNDVLLAISNSGGNAVVVGLVEHAKGCGVPVIVLTSLQHAGSSAARQGGTKIHDLADVVIDNHGRPGDAVIEVGGAMIGPTSTAVGSALLHAIMARVGQLLLDRGIEPEVFSSANMADGDARNATLLAKYDPRIRAL